MCVSTEAAAAQAAADAAHVHAVEVATRCSVLRKSVKCAGADQPPQQHAALRLLRPREPFCLFRRARRAEWGGVA